MSEPSQETIALSPKKSGKLLYALIAISIIGASGTGFLWFRHHKAAPKVEPPKVTSVLHLETFIVNLADEDQQTFLRVGIDLGVTGPESKAKEGEAPQSSAPIRDVILGVLMATRSSDLATVDGKQKLKQQLLRQVNERLPSSHVQEIYFTEYLLQR
jgi:flagellar basal body-associated protein FliL